MLHEVVGTYNLGLAALAFVIALIASYTALDLAVRTKISKQGQLLWLLGGATAMGTGIWAMHFIAMLAFQLPIPTTYDLPTTLLSFIYALFASGIALWLWSRSSSNWLLVSGGVCMGGAIAWMHYTGMAAMQFSAQTVYDLKLVVISIAIAILASEVALWSAIRLREPFTKSTSWQKLSSASVMAIAISGMHYTGMNAAHFFIQQSVAIEPHDVNQLLGIAIGLSTLFILGLTLVISVFDRRLTIQLLREQALQDNEQRFQRLIREMQVGILLLNANAEILISNQAALTLLNLTDDSSLRIFGKDWHVFHEDNTPFQFNELPAQRAIASRQAVHNIVMGIAQSEHGAERWLLVNVEPQLASDGSIERLVCTLSEITKQKQAETTLQNHQEFLNRVLNAVSDPIFVKDRQHRWIIVNDAFCHMIGHPHEALLGKSDYDFLSEAEADAFWQFDEYVFTTNKEHEKEEPLTLAPDNVRTLLTKKIAFTDGSGNQALVGLIRDITERKQADEALRYSESTNRALITAIPDILIRGKQDGTYSTIVGNEHLLVDHRLPLSAAGNIHDILPADMAQKRMYYVRKALETGTMQIYEQQLTIDNVPHYEEVRIVVTGEDEVLTIIRDITDRKRVENQVRQMAERERTIARAIQRIRQTLNLDTIFNTTTDELRQAIDCDRVLIYQFNPDWSGQIIAESVAEGWTPLLQIQAIDSTLAYETINNDTCFIPELSKTSLTIEDTYFQETKGGAYSRNEQYLYVSDIYEPGFAECYIQLLERLQARAYLSVPIFCSNKLWGLLMSYQNSSPRQWEQAEIRIVTQIGAQLGVAVQQAELLVQTQQQAEELKRAKESADNANRTKSEFLANMSHELRTPLNAILGFTQLMNRDRSLSLEQRDYLHIINRSGEHLLELINDILEMSKIEAGYTKLNLADFDLYNLLNDLHEMLQIKAQDKGLQLTFEYTADVPHYIKTDENKLRQVLINLLGNAIKFTQAGSVCLRVSVVSTELPSIQLQFEVEDTGFGIVPEELNQLFAAFEQTKAGMLSAQGTGLGLPISRRFVQLMGGDITVQSQPGVGSVFSFVIQAGMGDQVAIKSNESNSNRIVGLALNQPTYRILVAEDNPTNLLLLCKLLTSLGDGIEVKRAENGQVALEMWEQWDPHLIWMDMRMPVMNGYEATKQIKATLKGQATVIIALTASAFEEQRQAILAAGCDDFVRKPFRSKEIFTKMAHHLGLRYIYSDANCDDLSAASSNGSSAFTLSPSSLQVMPLEWIQKLHHAAVLCSDRLILDLIQQIPPDHALLAEALTQLADNFRFDQLTVLAQNGHSA